MKSILSVITFLILNNIIFAQTNEESIILETKTGNIEGSLTYPKASKKTPLAIIISGSGPTDRNGNNPMMINNSLKMLAEGLLENKIASLRFDKRGVGKSRNAGFKENELRFEHYIEDVKAWIDRLKKDTRFSEIIIIGHSEGSLIGMIAAQKPEVHKFISIAGAGVPASTLIQYQIKSQAPFLLNQSQLIIEKLNQGELVNEIPQMLLPIFRPSVQPYLISWFKYNPQKELSKLDKAIQIIQGTTDIQVSISDAEKLAEANKNTQKNIIEDMNHILKYAEKDRLKNMQTYSNPSLPLSEGLIDTIVKFINKK